MAVRDVREYYLTVLADYTEAKENLKDFEQAVADGNIPEENLQIVKDDLEVLKENYDRLTYIMVLLNRPNRRSKTKKYDKSNKRIIDELHSRNATSDDVHAENVDMLKHLKEELKQLTNETDAN